MGCGPTDVRGCYTCDIEHSGSDSKATPARSVSRVTALVPAAGAGARLGLGPKAFLELGGRTLLEIAVERVTPLAGRVLVGAAEADVDRARELVGGAAEVLVGGASRQETVGELLAAADSEWVLIHEIARPFASRQVFERVIADGFDTGASVGAFLPADVPLARHDGQRVTSFLDKEEHLVPQSPQIYPRALLDECYAYARARGSSWQTTWQMVVAMGHPLIAVEGDRQNIKITGGVDWGMAQAMIERR